MPIPNPKSNIANPQAQPYVPFVPSVPFVPDVRDVRGVRGVRGVSVVSVVSAVHGVSANARCPKKTEHSQIRIRNSRKPGLETRPCFTRFKCFRCFISFMRFNRFSNTWPL